MNKADVITLLGDTPESHGVFDTYTQAEREVMCTVGSVTRTEMYAALNAGLNPSYVFTLADYAEYEDEQYLLYNGKRYRIIRTYVRRDNGIELTAERDWGDAT